MSKNQLVICCVLAALIAGLPALCGAQSARVIPKGTLSVFENGKLAGEFQSETPLPEGSSLVCSGECLVQGEKFQLLAHDKAEFSLAKSNNEWVLTVKSGAVEFSMRREARLAFVTPKDTYEVTKAIAHNGWVRGRVDVTAAGVRLATADGVLYLASSSGVLYVTSADGIQAFQPGAVASIAHPTVLPEIPTGPPAGGTAPTGGAPPVEGGAVPDVAPPPVPTGIPAWAPPVGAVAAFGGVVTGFALTTQSGKPSASPQ